MLGGRFGVGVIGFSLSAVTLRNPVHAVLSLVGAFGSAAMLLMSLGEEFLALVLVVVYMGAVAVLFLFVVMMLSPGQRGGADIGGQSPLALMLGTVGMVSLVWRLKSSYGNGAGGVESAWVASLDARSSRQCMAQVLYTELMLHFRVAGGVLLVALVGAIVLTLEELDRKTTKRQQVHTQMSRNMGDAVYESEASTPYFAMERKYLIRDFPAPRPARKR